MVPKGFIRQRVLEVLNEKPMSGSEIMSDIEKQTGGFWKPSPGSIYPLLAWLQDNNYIQDLPTESGLKRYELTESGRTLLAQQTKIKKQLREEISVLPAPFFNNFLVKISPKKKNKISDSLKNLAVTFFELGSTLQENFSEEAIDEVAQVLNETSRKLNEVRKKIEGENCE
jgi:DNA-binding PadR family transcriptional regulator